MKDLRSFNDRRLDILMEKDMEKQKNHFAERDPC